MAQLREGSVIKKSTGDEIIATVNDIPEIPTSLPANGGDADTIGGFAVGTDVPANAKFTDTNTTYSEITTAEIDTGTASTGRTITGRRVKYILDKVSSMISVAIGALTKSSVGLGNVDNTSDASKPISTATQTALNGKVNNSQVLTNVPSGAKFTDTVYSHPSTHPASIITESSTKRFVSDSEKSTWNSKSDTDTVTTINGKTGAITKADIVALGIPTSDTNTTYSEITTAEIDTGTASTLRAITGRRVKYILDKVQGWIGGLTKSDIGLSNVDNTSDLAKPISTATQTQLTAINTKINNLSGGKGGESLFAGNGLEKTIAHGLGSIPTSAYAFPKVNPEGFLGEVWVRFDATNMYVGNTGSFTGEMVWGVIK